MLSRFRVTCISVRGKMTSLGFISARRPSFDHRGEIVSAEPRVFPGEAGNLLIFLAFVSFISGAERSIQEVPCLKALAFSSS